MYKINNIHTHVSKLLTILWLTFPYSFYSETLNTDNKKERHITVWYALHILMFILMFQKLECITKYV